MRQVVIARPFAGGYRSDVPDYALNPNECAYAQDLIYPFGIAQQRWGWAFDGSVADAAVNLAGVNRSSYPVVERVATVTTGENGYLYLHSQASSGTVLWDQGFVRASSPNWIPRCIYNGELILCAQDGVTPLLRYAGSNVAASSLSSYNGGMTLPDKSSSPVPVSGTFPAALERGCFFIAPYPNLSGKSDFPIISSLILAKPSSGALVSLDAIRNTSGAASQSIPDADLAPVAFAWPGVSVWDVGSSLGNGTSPFVFQFSGAELTNAGFPNVNTGFLPGNDALFIQNATAGAPHSMLGITEYVAGTPEVLKVYPAPTRTYAETSYRIARRLPFKDATVHKNSLWGCGVKQYPNRVFVGPPLWNIGIPPGAIEPFDPLDNDQFVDVDEFFLTPVDVPSRYDTDPVVALLSTPGPLLVLKGSSVYGIYGTYPSYEQTLIANGSGCIDLRSAVTVDGVAFWAGKDGVFMYAGGQIQPLTRGKIEREWQALMRGYIAGTSRVSTAVAGSHLVVCASGLNSAATGEAKIGPDASNPTDRTFIYDLRSQQWTSRVGNARVRNMTSSRVPGEVASILGVSDDRQGRVIDLTPMVTGTKCTDRASQTLAAADPTDAAGTGPRMQAWSSSSLAQANGIEGEARFLDLTVHTSLTDTAVTPTAALDVSTAHGDALDTPSTTVVAQGTITGDNVDRVDRTKFRVNKTGRLHQVRVDLDTTPPTTTKTQIPEMVASFRDNRRMT